MKTRKKDPHADHIRMVKLRLGEEVFDSLTMSFGTMSDILFTHLVDTSDPLTLPPQVKYAMVQIACYMNVLRDAFHDPEKMKQRIKGTHFDCYDPSMDLDAEKRFIFTVKSFYDDLKKKGKL